MSRFMTSNECLMILMDLIGECDHHISIAEKTGDKEEIIRNEKIKFFAKHDIAMIKETFDRMGIEYDKELCLKEV